VTQKPDFLKHLFVKKGLGYWTPEGLPVNLLDPQALRDRNPWIVLTALVERAKRGDFKNLGLIFPCLRASAEGAFWYACSYALSDAAPAPVLRQLVNEFRSEIWDKKDLWTTEYVVDTLYHSLRLWTVPILLKFYLEIEDPVRLSESTDDWDQPSLILIPRYLSQLLETEPGPIAESDFPHPEYGALVQGIYEQRCRELGSPEVAILNGKPFSVRSATEWLLAALTADEINEQEVAEGRMLFEASTGVDCRPFFKDFKLQPLTAAGIVEDFLDSLDAAKYKDGVRYFFGHRIPD
jgi:hypothetical protein